MAIWAGICATSGNFAKLQFYAKTIGLVARHCSAEHTRDVWAINLITTVWTDGDRVIPCDVRIYEEAMIHES